jgi:PKD repeat protein
LLVSNSSGDGFTLSWTAPGDDGGTGIVSGYLLKYSTNPIDSGNFDSATTYNTASWTNLKAGGASESRNLTGLNSDTLYYFAIKAYDNHMNYGDISNVPGGTTLDIIAPSVITDLNSTYISSDSITLSWTAPGDNQAIGTVSGYVLRNSTAPITEGNFASATNFDTSGWTGLVAAGIVEQRVINGLQANTLYYFAIKAVDETYNSSGISNIYSNTTLSLPPADILPTASFSVTGTLTPFQAIQFTFTGIEGNPSATYQWSFGDGTLNSTAKNLIHSFNKPGSYTVKLLVTDADGDQAFIQQVVVIVASSTTTTTSSSSSSTSSTNSNSTTSSEGAGDQPIWERTWFWSAVGATATTICGILGVLIKKKKKANSMFP